MGIKGRIRKYFHDNSLHYCLLCKEKTVEESSPNFFKQHVLFHMDGEGYYIRYYHPKCLEKVFANPKNYKDVLDRALWIEECIENKRIEEQGKLQDTEELLQKAIKKAKERSCKSPTS